VDEDDVVVVCCLSLTQQPVAVSQLIRGEWGVRWGVDSLLVCQLPLII